MSNENSKMYSGDIVVPLCTHERPKNNTMIWLFVTSLTEWFKKKCAMLSTISSLFYRCAPEKNQKLTVAISLVMWEERLFGSRSVSMSINTPPLLFYGRHRATNFFSNSNFMFLFSVIISFYSFYCQWWSLTFLPRINSLSTRATQAGNDACMYPASL